MVCFRVKLRGFVNLKNSLSCILFETKKYSIWSIGYDVCIMDICSVWNNAVKFFHCWTALILVLFNSALFLFGNVALFNAQEPVYFSYANPELNFQLNTGPHYAGAGVSTYDYNEDGWDDLTICISGSATLLYTNNNGQLEQTYSFPNNLETKQCLWFDLEEDGDNDLFVTRRFGPPQLWRQNAAGGFTQIDIPFSAYYYQNINMWGATLGDLNRDGYLDIYIACGGSLTDSRNILLINDAQGNFHEPQLSEPFYELMNGSKSSFQPVFVDFNRDNEQDLFVVNDYYQGNDYFEKNSLGIFQDKSIESGLFKPGNSMSNSWTDYDNDGDMDCFITSIGINHLMENNGYGQFEDVSIQRGVEMNSWNWSALWIDLENDGDDDLISLGRSLTDYSFYNYNFFSNDNGVFSQLDYVSMGLNQPAFIASKFDYNRDGKSDIIVIPDSFMPIKIFKNEYSTFHSANVTFKGRLSNRNAIGTRFVTWVNGQSKEHYLCSGQDYLAQYSQHYNIGMGDDLIIDSMEVFWLSGLEEVYYNIESGQRIDIIEGSSFGEIVSSQPAMCSEGDLIELSVSNRWPYAIWQNGQFSHSHTTNQPGSYYVTILTDHGHPLTLSYQLQIAEIPQVTFNVKPITCNGLGNGEIVAHVVLQDSVYSETLYSSLNSGVYPVVFLYNDGFCEVLDTIELVEPDTMFFAGPLELYTCSSIPISPQIEVFGGHAPYDWLSIEQGDTLFAGNYSLMVQDSLGCQLLDSLFIYEHSASSIEMLVENAACDELSNGVITILPGNGFLALSANQFPKIIDSLSSGNYSGIEWDLNGCSYSWSAIVEAENFFLGQLQVADSVWLCDSSDVSLVADQVQFTGQIGEIVSLNEQGEELYPGINYIDITHTNGCSVDTMVSVFVSEINNLFIQEFSNGASIELSIGNIENVDSPQVLWNNAQISNIIQVSDGGFFQVSVSDEHGCVWSDSLLVQLNNVLSLSKGDIRLMGNHIHNFSDINLSGVSVFDVLGQLVCYLDNLPPGDSFFVSYKSGTYFLKDNNQLIKRFIIP